MTPLSDTGIVLKCSMKNIVFNGSKIKDKDIVITNEMKQVFQKFRIKRNPANLSESVDYSYLDITTPMSLDANTYELKTFIEYEVKGGDL